jgi:hypothetical protein
VCEEIGVRQMFVNGADPDHVWEEYRALKNKAHEYFAAFSKLKDKAYRDYVSALGGLCVSVCRPNSCVAQRIPAKRREVLPPRRQLQGGF